MSTHNNDTLEMEILKKLDSQDPDEIRAAIFSVVDLGIDCCVEKLVTYLQSSSLGVQEAAEYALRKIRGSKVVQAIVPLLQLEDVAIRNSAIDILREIASDDIRTLYNLAHDDDRDIRIFAVDILGSSDSTISIPMLSEVLENDIESNVRYQSCISLGNSGDPKAVKVLVKALYDEEEWVRFAAVEALVNLKAENCTDILLSALNKSSEVLEATIINALGLIGNINAVSVLLQRLDKDSGSLRNLTVKAIIQILGARSLALFSRKELDKLYEYLLVALNDEDEEVVESACNGLSFIGDIRATQAIFNRISTINPDSNLFFSAINCLTSIGYNEGLKEALYFKNKEIVKAAIDICAHIGCRRSIGALIVAFDTFPVELQQLATHHLVKLGDRSDVSFFIELLDHNSDVSIIKEALYFIGEKVSCLSVSPEYLLPYLHHPVQEIREAALEACLALNDTDTNKQIISLFSSENNELRVMAIYAMGKINIEEYIEQISRGLNDPCPNVRKISIEALGQICGAKPEMFKILANYANDPDQNVRLALVELADQLNTKESIELILKMLEDKDSWICIRAIEAICKYNDPKYLPYIIQRLEGAELLVTLKILETLGVIGGSVAFHVLLGFANSESQDVQDVVTLALNRMQDR